MTELGSQRLKNLASNGSVTQTNDYLFFLIHNFIYTIVLLDQAKELKDVVAELIEISYGLIDKKE